MIVKKFNDFKVNESISLTDKEKDFLWNKMEVNKKKRNKEKETDVYQYLKGDKNIPDEEEFKKVLNSLEYTMKKRVKTGEAPRGKYEEAFMSLKNKLPESWMGAKYSSLAAKENRDKKED